MNARAIALALIALLSTDLRAGAAERGERLYSLALVEFHAGRFAAALELFDAAVAADPSDPAALYYRGVTRGRVADYAGAAEDLRASLALPGHPPRAVLELGVALVDGGRPAEAIETLRKAEEIPALASRAAFFLGIAELRVRDYEAAEESFARALRGDASLDLAVKYYRAVLAYERNDSAGATALFQEVADRDAESALGREASRFLAVLAGTTQKSYHLFAMTGFQYDSNVTLVPTDQQIPPGGDSQGRRDDGSAVFHVGGDFIPTLDRRATLLVGYDFFQSLHFDVTRFDLQRHRPHVVLTSDLDVVQLGVAGDYEYSLLRTDRFLGEWKALPWIAVPEQWGRSEVFYRFRRRDFENVDRDLQFKVLSGFNHSAGLRQLVFLGAPGRFVSIGYRYDNEDTRDASFSYDGHELNAGVEGELPARILGQLGYTYRHESYAGASGSATTSRRRDDEQHVGLTLSREFFDLLSVDFGYFFTFNGSNRKEFQYDRHVVSLTVRVDL